jgi:glycosyltransferase involved in cell wall biosynthesis
VDSVKLPITVIVPVRNERANIAKCLAGVVSRVSKVYVVDSASVDGTGEVAEAVGAEVVQFRYGGGYPKKRQWALDSLPISTEWVLMLDADEEVPESLWEEITRELASGKAADAYLITKGFHFMGRKFVFGGFSHSAVLLFRRSVGRFEHLVTEDANGFDMEVHERVIVNGRIGRLRVPLLHNDYKGLEAYLHRHNVYSTWEARVRLRYLSTGGWGESAIKSKPWKDVQSLRRFIKGILIRIPGEPVYWFLYHYVARLGCLHGRRGLIAARIRADYIANVRAKMYEARLNSASGS